jgi:hypothetical protein
VGGKKMKLAEKVKQASEITGSIMIESHLTIQGAVHRKPFFKKGRPFVRYYKRDYEIVGWEDLMDSFDPVLRKKFSQLEIPLFHLDY